LKNANNHAKIGRGQVVTVTDPTVGVEKVPDRFEGGKGLFNAIFNCHYLPR